MKRYTYYILALLMSLASCGDTEYEYSNHRCYFIFENTGSRSPALASATNIMSPGIFCRVTTSGENYYSFSTNQGLTDRVARTEIDKQRTVELGVYNETGIMVGFGNLNNHNPTRVRRLLLHKKEILKLKSETDSGGVAIIPLKMYFKKGLAKVLIALATGKKLYDKRESIKKDEAMREARRAMSFRR